MKTYLGYEVFSQATTVQTPVTERRGDKLSVVSNETGRQHVVDLQGFPRRTSKLMLVADGPKAIQELRQFILRRRGRVVPLWIPTGLADLEVSVAAEPGAVLITLNSSRFAGVFSTGVRSHLLIAGQPVGVRAATADGHSTVIELREGLHAPLKAGTRLEHLLLYRLSADDVSLEFEGVGFASTTVEFVEIPHES